MPTGDTHQQRRWLAWILGGIMTAVALFCLAVAGLRTWQAMASASWPQVQATVEQSGIQEERDSKGRTRYLIDVRYRYRVDGRELSASRVYFGDSGFLLESEAHKVLAPYAVGQVVTASYDPVDPQSAVLEPGRPRNLGLLFVLAGVFGVPGFGILLFAPRRRLSARTDPRQH